MAQLLTGLGSRSAWQIALEKQMIEVGRRVLPFYVSARFSWDSFREADACIANTAWEARLMSHVFGAEPGRVHVVPNGVEEVFLKSAPAPRGKWLVCTGTITERKRMLELAEAAARAGTPLWIIGKPYAETDDYSRKFITLMKAHPDVLRYEGAVAERPVLAKIYREARGFVLLSTMETRSLAAEEAAACQCPLLLSDLPWARSVFGESARYCPVTRAQGRTASHLREFYEAAPGIRPPPRPKTWDEVAESFRKVYESCLAKQAG